MTHFLRIFFIFTSIFIASYVSADIASASTCTWWSSSSCTDPSRIPVCNDGNCTLSGGIRITQAAVGDTLSRMSITDYIRTIVRYFLSFVTLVAVIYVMYAGFRVMTSGGDEEQSKKARRTIIYVLVGILIMWLAYWIVKIIINALDRT